jgi:hypothetical protein
LPLAGTIGFLAKVLAILGLVRRLHVSAEVRAINFNIALQRPFLARETQRLPELVKEHEAAFIIAAEIA